MNERERGERFRVIIECQSNGRVKIVVELVGF